MKKIRLLMPILAAPTLVGTLMPLTNCSSKNVVETADFATDSWENLINCANKGMKALVQRYQPRGGTLVITPTDITQQQIAAKTRTIHIDGYGDFKVRVAGECIDKIDDNTNAALTFEFTEIITKDSFHNDLTVSNPGSYVGSHIRTKLSEIFDCFPTILKNNIKTVQQTTAVITDSSNYDQAVTDEKLFIMTLDEVYGVRAASEQAILSENACYQFYQYTTHQLEGAHIKQYFNPTTHTYESCNWWLRTPIILELESYKDECYAINSAGFYTNQTVDQSIGISPCFCLGSEQNGIINIGCSAPGFEICSSQIVDTNNDIVLTIKPKQYQNQDVLTMPEGSDTGKAEFKIFNEDGRIYSDNFKYDATTGTITFVQNRINKSLVFEMWNSQIALDYKTFVALCEEDEKNNMNGNLVLEYLHIGNWLNIKLDNVDYKVNVIDIDHDDMGSGKKAAVTLEFYTPMAGYKWDDNGDNIYEASSLNRNLNGTKSTSIINKLRKACPDLASGIKTVNKNVFAWESDVWQVKSMSTKLFVLSDDEILTNSSNRVFLGTPYRFYSESDNAYDKSKQGNEVWTRSTDITSTDKCAFVVGIQMGTLKEDPYQTNQEGTFTSPAFCI